MESAVGGGHRALDELARDQVEALTFGRGAATGIGTCNVDVSEMASEHRPVAGVELDGDDRSLVLTRDVATVSRRERSLVASRRRSWQ